MRVNCRNGVSVTVRQDPKIHNFLNFYQIGPFWRNCFTNFIGYDFSSDLEFEFWLEGQISSHSLRGAHENSAFTNFRLRWLNDSWHLNARSFFTVSQIESIPAEMIHKFRHLQFFLVPSLNFALKRVSLSMSLNFNFGALLEIKNLEHYMFHFHIFPLINSHSQKHFLKFSISLSSKAFFSWIFTTTS